MSRPVLRDWLYQSGDVFLPRKYVDMLDTYIINTPLFYLNVWSFLHLLSGVVFRLVFPKLSVLAYVIGHSLWELWQIYIGMTPLTLRGGIDVVVDTLMGVLGYSLASKISYVSSGHSNATSYTRSTSR